MPFIIDGYNLLRSVQGYEEYASYDEEMLCRVLSEYLKRVRNQGQIIFDGIGPPDKSGLGGIENLEVYFSGEDLEADDVIEDKIISSSAPKNLIIITSDREIRIAASHRKCTSVPSDIFWLSLTEQLEKKLPIREPKEKREGITEKETEDWMDEFGL